jgi:hypothetical protein
LVPQVITGLASGFKRFGKLEPGGEPPGPETCSMIAATMPAPQRNAVFRLSPSQNRNAVFRISPFSFAVGAFRHDGSIITR